KSCLHDAQQGIEHYDAADRSFHIQKFVNHDPMVCALAHSAITEWVLSFPERAFLVADRTSCMMEATKHIPTTIVGQYALCILFAYARSLDRLRMTATDGGSLRTVGSSPIHRNLHGVCRVCPGA